MLDLTAIPAGLFLASDSHGRAQVCCMTCAGRALVSRLEQGDRIAHAGHCRSAAQVPALAPARTPVGIPAALDSHQEVAQARRTTPRGESVCNGRSDEQVARWVRDGAVSQSDAMNRDF